MHTSPRSHHRGKNYPCAVDLTVLMALSTIASEQLKGTDNTIMLTTKQLLDYLATNPNAMVRFRASDMILNIHSNASYLLEVKVHSCACGHFFMGWRPDPTKPIKVNGAFLPCVRYCVSSSRRPQKPNSERFSSIANMQRFLDSCSKRWDIQSIAIILTAVGIANNTIKHQRSRLMGLHFFPKEI